MRNSYAMNTKEKFFQGLYDQSKKVVNRFLIILDHFRNLDFYRSVEYQIDDCFDYECTHIRVHGMIKDICKEVDGEDSILDVGCGKGRMLWFFSKFPFCRVDGIEYNPEIAAIARSNIEKLNLKSRIFVMDACDFTQWADYNWFYFYNPFPDRVMDICLRNMVNSLQANPRRLRIIYVNPVCHQLLLDRGFTEVPIKISLLEKIWFPNVRYLRMYRYDL
jgi:SAM-dependent methyltransferase